MNCGFTLFWIVFWAYVLDIFSGPGFFQVIAFILIGIGVPLGLGKMNN